MTFYTLTLKKKKKRVRHFRLNYFEVISIQKEQEKFGCVILLYLMHKELKIHAAVSFHLNAVIRRL